MSDARLRDLERKAKTGGPEDRARYQQELQRREGVRNTMFHGCLDSPDDDLVGEYIVCEAGPNYADVGRVRRVYLDPLGVPTVVLDNVRRKSDEHDGADPTWLLEQCGDGWTIQSTSCSGVQLARKRWPGCALFK